MVLDNLFSCNVLKTNIRRNKDLFQVSSDWWLPQLMEFFSILNMVDKTLGIPVFIFERKIPKHVRMLLTGVSWLHIWLQSYMKVDFEMNITQFSQILQIRITDHTMKMYSFIFYLHKFLSEFFL